MRLSGLGGQLDAGVTHLGQLVAQGARADAELVGHRFATAVALLQGVQNDLVLLLLEFAKPL